MLCCICCKFNTTVARGVARNLLRSLSLHLLSPLFHSPFLPSPPSLSTSFPTFSPLPTPSFPSLRSRPHIAARGLGKRLSSLSGSGRSPAAKRFLVNFRLKIVHLVAMVLRSYSGNATTWSGIKLLPVRRRGDMHQSPRLLRHWVEPRLCVWLGDYWFTITSNKKDKVSSNCSYL